MAVKIIIKRRVPGNRAEELVPHLKQLRVLAMNQEGYIGGETLKRIDDPDEFLVISTWQRIEDWKKWYQNEERSRIQKEIDALLGKETEYAIYNYQ